ncbi:MAG: putative glycine dehydrogenase (decarboxylating) subunit 1 [Verrucomicrobia subdivision 3 bacterium]|nr:putative glycine dehydrogenase (decarboxylating) subunit 1 [Limisphaerales bacterium]MCS1413485.1 putative glycine dehydrogenase (decarboxylating) subunit 1 [Limisphaerales bacterium]
MHAPELIGYNVHPASDRESMLKSIGVKAIEDLFATIPSSLLLNQPLDLPARLPEWKLERRFRELSGCNQTTHEFQTFLGGGAYEHYIPETVRTIASRGEFLTAYTPYQPEMSQGTLRVLHDFQTLMAKLLGQPAVNCSVYDGATALAESSWMACRITGNKRLVVAANIWPEYQAVLETYMQGRGVELVIMPSEPTTGEIDLAAMTSLVAESPTAAVIAQSPNRYGVIESVAEITKCCHGADTLAVVSCYPISLGCLRSPGSNDTDIICCEAQPLGLELNAGGPYLGVIATRQEFELHLPGRLVGVCDNLKGEPVLALVKEEREQHVARHKATSHICSNQALLALRTSVYLATLGEQGFRRISSLCAAKARYLYDKLIAIKGIKSAKTGAFFNEFLINLPCPAGVILKMLRENQIFGGIDFSEWEPSENHRLLIAVTEVKTREDLDQFVHHFQTALNAAT